MVATRGPVLLGLVISIAVLAGAVGLVARFGSAGFARFSSKEFWSFYAGTLIAGLFFAGFLGLMSTDSPKSTVFTALFSAEMVFFGMALIGLFPAYFLIVPKELILRVLTGLVGVPIVTSFVGGIFISIAGFFSKLGK